MRGSLFFNVQYFKSVEVRQASGPMGENAWQPHHLVNPNTALQNKASAA